MSLRDWVQYNWLTEHKSSREEIKNLLGLAHRDLRACQAKGLDADWRFAIAYNAALQAATAALPLARDCAMMETGRRISAPRFGKGD